MDQIAIYFLWAAWVVSWMAASVWTARTKRRPPFGEELISRVFTVIGALLLFGLYWFVRHPIYTGIIIASFATAIDKGTYVALAGAVLMLVGWFIKARVEERFLRTELGPEAYDAYARKTAMLVPFVRV